MMLTQSDIRIIAITPQWEEADRILEAVKAVLAGGAPMIQYREKKRTGQAKRELAERLMELTKEAGAHFIINDDVDLAKVIGASGVHLGQGDLAIPEARRILGDDFIIGASAHNLAEAKECIAQGADYLGCGALYATATKSDTVALPLEELSKILSHVDVPLVGIGGIRLDHLEELKQAGLQGVALCSAIFEREDPKAWTKAFLNELKPKSLPVALTIAGSDSSGGAGIQADLKTMTALGVFGTSAITALTAQNTLGVQGILAIEPDFVKAQLDAIFQDIPPQAVKIGMTSSAELMDAIADRLSYYGAKNLVLDPVMVSTSGSKLMEDAAVAKLKASLLPLADLVTPNRFEAEILAQQKIESKEDMVRAGQAILALGCRGVLVKGGHLGDNADDCLVLPQEVIWFEGPRFDNPNTHGTGCTLSSAIASFLAKGYDLSTAVAKAKAYLTQLIAYGLDLGAGRGPLNHMAAFPREMDHD